MPLNREPHIYPGYVISLIGQSVGERVTMEFKNAQACVSSGTHRWHDDETDLPATAQIQIAEREQREREAAERDAEINGIERLRRQKLADAGLSDSHKSVADALKEQSRGITITTVPVPDGEIDGHPNFKNVVYLARPFPNVTSFEKALFDGDSDIFFIVEDEKDPDNEQNGDLVMKLENAIAQYRPAFEETFPAGADGKETTIIYATKVHSAEPEVAIPDGWRDRHFLQNIAAAKLIRQTKEPVKKDEATAIIEEWVKKDDQNAPKDAGGDTSGENQGTPAADRFKGDDGQPVDAEERARQAAENFNDGIDFDD